MNVGRMRYRINIEDYISSTDLDGFVTEDWVNFTTVWADITPVSSKEYLNSAQTLAEVTSKIYIRYISSIKTTMRIIFGDRIFNIQSILPDERNGIITIMAKEIV